MLTYRGDKFVRGKKFKINECEYRFSRRNENKLIFEAIKDGSKYVITEEEYNELNNDSVETDVPEKTESKEDYINKRINQVYEDILLLAQEADHNGFHHIAISLQQILDRLENLSAK